MSNAIVVAIIAGLMGGGFTSLVQFLIQRHDKQKELDPDRFEELIRLAISETQDRLVFLGERYIDQGYISLRDWSMYDEMFTHYSTLGGNHFAAEIHKSVKDLPKKNDK